jgi:Spy/CpxP family protein refolding chaperone
MLKKVWIGILLIFMVSLAGTAAGQDVPTQKEISKLDQLYAKSHRKLIKLKNAVEREQFELDELLGEKTVDDAKVRKQFKQLESARTDLADERLGFVIGVRGIIGAERFQQLKTSYKKWR